MQKCEYCVLAGGQLNRGSILTPKGREEWSIRRDKSKGDENDGDAVNRTIAEFGLDGWQMISGQGPGFWFKRPIQDAARDTEGPET